MNHLMTVTIITAKSSFGQAQTATDATAYIHRVAGWRHRQLFVSPGRIDAQGRESQQVTAFAGCRRHGAARVVKVRTAHDDAGTRQKSFVMTIPAAPPDAAPSV